MEVCKAAGVVATAAITIITNTTAITVVVALWDWKEERVESSMKSDKGKSASSLNPTKPLVVHRERNGRE
uniref:Transmembrane protein n=1 Tax=Loa loa TaxID=7209 RepID=A0A1I7VKV8_LOALO